MSLANTIKSYAMETCGFDACNITTPCLDKAILERRTSWLNKGFEGDMEWLVRHEPFKQDPAQLLPGVQSAIVLAASYRNTHDKHLKGPYKIARYAVGLDYHDVLADRMVQLEAWIKELAPGTDCYWGVDSRPIAERELAVQSGLGFQGRNTLIIRPGLGSYFFLAVMLTTLSLPRDNRMPIDCGTCRRCLDACPTGAILEDGSLDARACISYQTIEQKSPMSSDQLSQAEGWIYGCDICQEVCPFNKEGLPLSSWPSFHPDQGVGFDFFRDDKVSSQQSINKQSPLYRSRKRLLPNYQKMKELNADG